MVAVYWNVEEDFFFKGSLCMFEVDATPVFMALFFPRVSGRKRFLSQWLCCSLPVCFQNKQGETVQLRPGIREMERPILHIFSFVEYFLPLPTFNISVSSYDSGE